ncbi:MipA/OmpV family protein [Rhizorhapis suberifaciens]|uniref:Outer membrane scaffolding protein for murein synthesis (MipA/OmpV family) n=1 Tax=Rhizorhapis suberifaciens TaxID=13656 RepID=A0A840HS14_9SPHN|nr:MipA/OmpV family protein [Rhizorhapis suberifaciens]MBB4640326.1 outer membrane scaffolding protein for murein synthesis (MipA/OmpV family) [Rhizorhapis suberifaciens]
MTRQRLLALCLFPLVIPNAFAQEQGPPAFDPHADSITITAGGAYVPSYEGSDDYSLIPGAQVRGRVADIAFFTRGTNIFVDVFPDSGANGWDIELGPVANLRLDRAGGIKDPQVKALGKLDEAFELGGWVGIARTGVLTSAYDNLSFRISYLMDVGNAHDSYVITPSIEYGTPLSLKAYAGLSVSADYVGKGYGHTYFDVTPAGLAASGLSPYRLSGSGFKNVRVGGFVMHSLTGDLAQGGLSIGGGVSYSRLLGKYADSPIVSEAGDADQWAAAVGLSYTF